MAAPTQRATPVHGAAVCASARRLQVVPLHALDAKAQLQLKSSYELQVGLLQQQQQPQQQQ
jgi:hypothetical protein